MCSSGAQGHNDICSRRSRRQLPFPYAYLWGWPSPEFMQSFSSYFLSFWRKSCSLGSARSHSPVLIHRSRTPRL